MKDILGGAEHAPKGILNSWELCRLRCLLADCKYKPRIYLVTSNAVKVTHFQHLFGLFGVPLRAYSSPIMSYSEPEDCSPEESLRASIDSVVKECGKRGFFFIEDSTWELEALSGGRHAVPGLKTKDFLRDNSFQDIDAVIEAGGGGRVAKIVSRVALHIGKGVPEEIFEGVTCGRVARAGEIDGPRTTAPWLSEYSPANVFIPDGEEAVLSCLPIERSYDYDTRLKVVVKLLYRVAAYSCVAEAPQRFFQGKRATEAWRQIPLFRPKSVLVVGFSGAGKTTGAIYLSRRYRVPYYEQSNLVKAVAQSEGANQEELPEFVSRFVAQNGPLAFVKKAFEFHGLEMERPFILSGLRTTEEVQFIKRMCVDVTVLFVECEFKLRSNRRVLAGASSKNALMELDRLEKRWGMEELRELADVVVKNNGSMDKYFDDLDVVANKGLGGGRM